MPSRDRVRVVRIDEDRRVADHLGQRRDVRGHDRRAAGHGFERRQPEALVERREHEHRREPVEHRQRLIGHEAEEAHVLVQVVRVDGASQRRVLRDVVADDQQLQVIEAVRVRADGTLRSAARRSCAA